MNSPVLSDELRRFIHTIASVPHLEAMLLLQQTPGQDWHANAVARRLYLSDGQAAEVLRDLGAAGICEAVAAGSAQYIYAPAFPELDALIAQLGLYYSRNLIEVTNLIHAKVNSGPRVQQFADAFK